jgi:hypothetical protein
MGIAMCHFALAAAENGLNGDWEVRPPSGLDSHPAEYTITWRAHGADIAG